MFLVPSENQRKHTTQCVLEREVLEKRTRGRTQKTWNMAVVETLKERNTNWEEAKSAAKDRNMEEASALVYYTTHLNITFTPYE